LKNFYLLTLKGSEILGESEPFSPYQVSKTKREDTPTLRTFLYLVESGEANIDKHYPKLVEKALHKGYIEEDRRTANIVLGAISRRDRDLSKLLRVYDNIAKGKPTSTVEIDEALLIASERASKIGKDEKLSNSILMSIRKSLPEKIEALDSFVFGLHRDYLVEEKPATESYRSYMKHDSDVARILHHWAED